MIVPSAASSQKRGQISSHLGETDIYWHKSDFLNLCETSISTDRGRASVCCSLFRLRFYSSSDRKWMHVGMSSSVSSLLAAGQWQSDISAGQRFPPPWLRPVCGSPGPPVHVLTQVLIQSHCLSVWHFHVFNLQARGQVSKGSPTLTSSQVSRWSCSLCPTPSK